MRRRTSRFRGFTLVEALLLVGVLGVTADIVAQSLLSMSNTAVQNNNALLVNDALLSQMEYLRSAYKNITPGWSDTSSIAGTTYSITSAVSNADPKQGQSDDDHTTSTTFLSLSVQCGDQIMTTYVSE
ncbi:MAG TPA: type II secretion system protein [Tepidisphaeraceae bacterium]|nr:type II secretion system protein [Tepidisphaeraceae bacterium]